LGPLEIYAAVVVAVRDQAVVYLGTHLLVGFISKNDIIQRKYDGTGVSKPFLANIHGGSEACI
jgi:hypothetical protein